MKFWVLDKATDTPLYFKDIAAVTDYVVKTLGISTVIRRKVDGGYLFSAGEFYLVAHNVEG